MLSKHQIWKHLAALCTHCSSRKPFLPAPYLLQWHSKLWIGLYRMKGILSLSSYFTMAGVYWTHKNDSVFLKWRQRFKLLNRWGLDLIEFTKILHHVSKINDEVLSRAGREVWGIFYYSEQEEFTAASKCVKCCRAWKVTNKW